MARDLLVAALPSALTLSSAPQPPGSDLSGRWTRESAAAPGGGAAAGHVTHSVRHGGTRVLESLTDLRLDADRLVVETTRFVAGSAPEISTTRYRR